MARNWRNRWWELSEKGMPVAYGVQDTERSGAPLTFSAEQVIQLFAIACEDPQASGRPISQWTARELAQEMKRRGIALEHLGATCGAITLKLPS